LFVLFLNAIVDASFAAAACHIIGRSSRHKGSTFFLIHACAAIGLCRASHSTPAWPDRHFEFGIEAGLRLTWSEDEKAAIIAVNDGLSTSISAVAHRTGLSAMQLFTWWRSARKVISTPCA
jgi:hypothetical protein